MRSSIVLVTAFVTATSFAQRIPLNDLGNGKYLGQFEGALYEHGSSVAPADHESEGLRRAAMIRPINGKIVMVSIGMSNTTQEFCAANNPAPCESWSFVGQSSRDTAVNHSNLLLVNGARGGQAASTWEQPTRSNYDYVRDRDLTPAEASESQVQVAWVKVANPQPTVSLPSPSSDADQLVTQMGNIVRALRVRYPNIRIVYLSSRIYAGYATSMLNPEPYAYESGFAVKWLIQAQIDQMRTGHVDLRAGDLSYNTVAPWLAWGPYLWADGMNPRGDGLTWSVNDVEAGDRTHPSQSGEQKVGAMLLAFLKEEPTARPWFLAASPSRRRAVRTH